MAKARMERAEAKAAMELPYALPYVPPNDRANAGDQIAIHQISLTAWRSGNGTSQMKSHVSIFVLRFIHIACKQVPS